MQRKGMDLLHQCPYRGISLLVALDRIQSGELLADDHGFVMCFLPATVCVAFIEHFKVLGLQGLQGVLDQIELAHSRVS
ncbi:MAG: hypothetical protein A2180_07505 [Pseudomonadales bacterium GWC2_63_15]|nr:MAG: hypothetical protein A2180_07505 [Pseudomonadales bacterium GWC2_63_15]